MIKKPDEMNVGQNVAIACVQVYQRVRPALDQLLNATFGFSSACKHKPTCSEYTIVSIRRYGTIRGLITGIQRIIRCR